MAKNTWQDSSKIYDPIDYRTTQIDFIDTMTAEHPIFETYYDPANVEVHGKEGTFVGGQMSDDSPLKWADEFMFNKWPSSEDLEAKIPLVEYGLFGDRSSKDFGRMAFEEPEILEKHLDSKINIVYEKWKRTVGQVILHGLCNKDNYATNAIKELDKDYFKIDTDNKKIAENQAKAVNIVAEIENTAYAMVNYSKDWNKDGKEAVVKNLQDLILIMDTSVNTFLNTYGYSQVFNAGYIDLKMKIGRIVITKVPTIADGDLKPLPGHTIKKTGDDKYATGNPQLGDWRILLHDKNFYKINDVINVPKGEGVFLETTFYLSSLKNLIGKWYWAVQGCIPFCNAAAWKCKTA